MKSEILEAALLSIDRLEYYRIPNTTCVVCAIITKNKLVFIGEAHTIEEEDFNEEIGKKIGYVRAYEKLQAYAALRTKDDLNRVKKFKEISSIK
jgi:hypothetical protein